MANIKDDPVYKDEYLRHQARLDLEDERVKAASSKNKKEQNKKLNKNLLIGFIVIVVLYFAVYIPISNMLNAI